MILTVEGVDTVEMDLQVPKHNGKIATTAHHRLILTMCSTSPTAHATSLAVP
jgi:hypothetical protein